MFDNENRHYSLRKLSVGLASVLIGISFASSINGSSVKADTVNNGSNDAQTVAKSSDTVINNDAKVAASNTESALKASKKDPNVIAQDIKQKAIKASEAVTKLQDTAETIAKGNTPEVAAKNVTDSSQAAVKAAAENTLKGTNLIVKQQNTAVKDNANAGKDDSSKAIAKNMLKEGKAEVKENHTKADPAKSKLKMATLLATAGKKFNAQMLFESKVMSPTKDTNGGFDSSWGKLNVNDWKGNVQGDYYQLTDYTGDANHVIVPNEADFAKAGISTSGKQVGVTSKLMHTIFTDKATAQDATVAFSKTDNKMVKAINASWYETWNSRTGKGAKLSKFDGTNLDVSNISRMTGMFFKNNISDFSPLKNWDISNVFGLNFIFNDNSSIQTNTVQAKRIINFVYPDGYTGKKQDPITQIVNVPTQKVRVECTTTKNVRDPHSNNILDWVTKTETPISTSIDPVYFQDYTVPEIKGLLEPDKTVVSREQADIAKPINVTVTYKLVDSNTNDAFALDSKNGLHEHANVNDNGGYDTDFWGKINVDDWDYTVNGDRIEINGLKDSTSTGVNDTVIVPNLDDFKLVGKDSGAKAVYISYNALGKTAKHKYYGLSKTNGNTFTTDSYLFFAFYNNSNLTHADLNSLNTGNVTDMDEMFAEARSLTSLDVSTWDTSRVTGMSAMFSWASNLNSLDVSKWDISKVTNMSGMFSNASSLALIANSGKFADYLVNHDSFAKSKVNSDVKSVTTDNTKLLQLLTNDSQHNSATRTIVFTFPANYSPDLTKYHLTKIGNTYQIKQSADYDKPYLQGTVLINATDDITEHHIDTTQTNKLSDTWQPNYNKLVLAHKNSDGSVSFDDIQLPQIPGYKTVANPVNPAMALFAVSFMALPKPVAPAINDAKPAETVTPAKPEATEVAKPIKTEPKVATTPKVIDLSEDAVTVTPKETIWRVSNEPDQDTYHVSNGKYAVELPHISNAQLHVIANDSTKDSVLFTYKGQNSKYVFKIKFVNGHYLLTTYKIKSGKLVKLIDYNFVKASKMIAIILDWIILK